MHVGNNSQPIQTNGQVDTQRGQQGQNITDLDNLVSALSAKSLKNKSPESPPPTLTAKKPQFDATQEEVDAFDALTEPPKTLDDFDLSEGDSTRGALDIRQDEGQIDIMGVDAKDAQHLQEEHDSALKGLNEANQQPTTLDDFDDFINEQGGGSRVQAGYDIRNASTPKEKSLAAEEMLLDKESIKNQHDEEQLLKDEMGLDHESQATSNARADDETLQKAGDDSDPIDLDNYTGRPITEEEGKQIDDFLSQFPETSSSSTEISIDDIDTSEVNPDDAVLDMEDAAFDELVENADPQKAAEDVFKAFNRYERSGPEYITPKGDTELEAALAKEQTDKVDNAIKEMVNLAEQKKLSGEVETPPAAPSNPPKTNREPLKLSEQDVAELRNMLIQQNIEGPHGPEITVTERASAPQPSTQGRKVTENPLYEGASISDASTVENRPRAMRLTESRNPLHPDYEKENVRSVGPLRRKASSVAGKVKSLFGRISFPSFSSIIHSFKAKSKTPPAA